MTKEWTKVAIGITFFIVGAVVGGTAILHPWVKAPDPETNIIFPDIYGDAGPPRTAFMNDIEDVQGRWDEEVGGAEGRIFRKNNYAIISCVKNKSECLYSLIEQIGPNQLGDLQPATRMPIMEWDNYVITASDRDEDATGCTRTTINIDRTNRSAELVMEPINQSKLECAHDANKVYKYILKNPLSWYATHPNAR